MKTVRLGVVLAGISMGALSTPASAAAAQPGLIDRTLARFTSRRTAPATTVHVAPKIVVEAAAPTRIEPEVPTHIEPPDYHARRSPRPLQSIQDRVTGLHSIASQSPREFDRALHAFEEDLLSEVEYMKSSGDLDAHEQLVARSGRTPIDGFRTTRVAQELTRLLTLVAHPTSIDHRFAAAKSTAEMFERLIAHGPPVLSSMGVKHYIEAFAGTFADMDTGKMARDAYIKGRPISVEGVKKGRALFEHLDGVMKERERSKAFVIANVP